MTPLRADRSHPDHHEALQPLLERYLDATLDDAGFAELQQLLRTDADARRCFLRVTTLHGHLHARTRSESNAEPGARNAQRSDTHGTRAGVLPRSAFRDPAWRIAAALIAACGVAIFLLLLNPEPSPPEPSAAPLATLIEATDGATLTTPGGFISEGRDYPRGEYTLSGGGSAEFMLTNSVNVKLRGDTRMLMRNDMNVALTYGSAAFVVPRDAKNFTVHLPGGSRVVDLGTAFTTVVGEDDAPSTVRVTEGEVELHTPTQTLRITAGQLCKIDAQNHATVVADGSSDWLIAHEDTVLYYPMQQETQMLANAAGGEDDPHYGLLGDPFAPDTVPAWSTSHVPDKPGLRFDAAKQQFVRVGNSRDLDLSAAGTIALWVKLDDPAQTAHLVNKVVNPASEFNLAWTGGASPKLFMHVGKVSVISSPIEPTRGWRHVAATWKAGDAVVLYLDGREVGRKPLGDNVKPVAADITIGQAAWAPAAGFTGTLGDLVILSGALDPDSIQTLHESVDPASDDSPIPVTDGTADRP